MNTLAPIPEVGKSYWFFANDQVKEKTECEAIVTNVYSFEDSATKTLPIYDAYLEYVIDTPLMDIWIEQLDNLFWILSEQTDFIIELEIPELCSYKVYVARTIDGGWHSFETINPIQFGFLDVTGENHNWLHDDNRKKSNEIHTKPKYY